MNSKKNFVIALLALTTVTTGVLAWQQYQRNQHTVVASFDNDALLKKLSAAERHAADLEARLAALQAAPHPEGTPPEGQAAAAESRPNDRRGPNNSRRADMEALMNNPEVVKLMASQQKAQLDNRYAALFKQLNLTPAQLEAFKNLLLEKQNGQRDVMMAARESGLNPRESRDELRKLVEQTNAENDAAIAAAIGQDKFAQYQNYDATRSQRAVVDQLDNVMAYAATPLTAAQSQALVQILASETKANTGGNQRAAGGFAGGPFGGFQGGGSNNVTITDTMITQAQAVLSSSQVKVLQEQQAAQQSEQKLREIMRAQMQANRPPGE